MPAGAQEITYQPGTHWGLVLPDGFETQTNPLVFHKHPSGAVIVVMEGPAKPIDRNEFLPLGKIIGDGRNRGHITSVEETSVGGRQALMIKSRMVERNADSFLQLVGGETTQGMFILAVPDSARSAFDLEAALAALRTAVERPLEPSELLSQFPLELTDLAGMQVDQVLMGNSVLLSDAPDLEGRSDASSVFLAALPARPGDTFDIDRDGPGVTDQVRQKYPTATILSSGQITTPSGPALEVIYSHRDEAGKMLGGNAWARKLGDHFLIAITEHPAGDANARARQLRVFNGARAR